MSQEKQLTEKIVPFYLGEQQDSQGRMIQEMWAWNFEELECTHDFIQWLFPLPERSAFNSDAPIVNDQVIQAFQGDSILRQNLRRSLAVMLRFYGLQRQESNEGNIVITQSQDYPNRQWEWANPFNHNYLRITRILKCLMGFGLEDEAQAFYECLRQIYQESSDRIGDETFQHWANAVKASASS
ncbi:MULTISPECIES: opioid growth factor receptor-related protein [Cyanophyceae]|uniref:opioid growth factor receptor-related protein n=1 Tax=Cyanophyceae TaxID=3028117 RepID=UPI001686F760|nr:MULTISPECIES: opioid growth factor receptor-related protein [Cyanophyceae]MBD1918541.1 hypothetical protein [Phormidium sp. FACHB-77]MBD2031430.1 hypothetical protein [Phormidium sp. FACHB-322]MBD2049549.1 hypothetical protein [Leptolyngbya sp. FACHB-60]